jgi:hypothetical protein
MHTLSLLLLLFAGPTTSSEDSGASETGADDLGSDSGSEADSGVDSGDDDPGAGPPGPKPRAKGCAVADAGLSGLLVLAPLLLRRRRRSAHR